MNNNMKSMSSTFTDNRTLTDADTSGAGNYLLYLIVYLCIGFVVAFNLVFVLKRKLSRRRRFRLSICCTEEEELDPDLEDLHASNCVQDEVDLLRMRIVLQFDPDSLERLQYKRAVVARNNRPPTYPLHDAIARGHVNCVKLLVEFGASVDGKSPDRRYSEGETPLEVAYNSNRLVAADIIIYLVEQGAQLNIHSGNYVLPHMVYPFIERKLQNNDLQMLRLVLQHGAVADDMEMVPGTNRLRTSTRLPQNTSPLPFYRRVLHMRKSPSHSPVTVALMGGNTKAYESLLAHGARNRVYYHHDKNYDYKFSRFSVPLFILFMYREHHEDAARNENEVMDALEVYQRFGGNLWARNEISGCVQRYSQRSLYMKRGETALELLQRSAFLRQSFPTLIPKLEERMSQPLSLQQLSRIAVRNSMGPDMRKNIPLLPLPAMLKTFLMFEVTENSQVQHI